MYGVSINIWKLYSLVKTWNSEAAHIHNFFLHRTFISHRRTKGKKAVSIGLIIIIAQYL